MHMMDLPHPSPACPHLLVPHNASSLLQHETLTHNTSSLPQHKTLKDDASSHEHRWERLWASLNSTQKDLATLQSSFLNSTQKDTEASVAAGEVRMYECTDAVG